MGKRRLERRKAVPADLAGGELNRGLERLPIGILENLGLTVISVVLRPSHFPIVPTFAALAARNLLRKRQTFEEQVIF